MSFLFLVDKVTGEEYNVSALTVPTGSITLGRSRSNDIVTRFPGNDDPTIKRQNLSISRTHAKIENNDGVLTIADTSRNGCSFIAPAGNLEAHPFEKGTEYPLVSDQKIFLDKYGPLVVEERR
jgi:hypothetical protein